MSALEPVRDETRPVAAASGPWRARSAHRVRIVDGALRCIAMQGMSKTTLDDVARAAGCSRATLYRAFPGGKDEVVRAVVETELARLFSELAVHMGEAGNLEEALVAGMSIASIRIAGAPCSSSSCWSTSLEIVLPHLAFSHLDQVLITRRKLHHTFPGPLAGPRRGSASGGVVSPHRAVLRAQPGRRHRPHRPGQCPAGSPHLCTSRRSRPSGAPTCHPPSTADLNQSQPPVPSAGFIAHKGEAS